jgi:hypothetical protein
MSITNRKKRSSRQVVIQSDGAKRGSYANAAQDDIYKSAPSPVILEERSDEESQTEPLPAALEKVYYATLSRRLNRSGEERLHDCRDLTFKS